MDKDFNMRQDVVQCQKNRLDICFLKQKKKTQNGRKRQISVEFGRNDLKTAESGKSQKTQSELCKRIRRINQKDRTMEEKQNNGKSETKDSGSNTKSGTEQNPAWEKAAENIAGDNQLMAGLLKLLLSPFALLASVGLIVYLFVKNQQLKKEIEKLKEENKELAEDNSHNSERADHYQAKYKKMKRVFEIDQNQTDNYSLPENSHTTIKNVNKNKISLLR